MFKFKKTESTRRDLEIYFINKLDISDWFFKKESLYIILISFLAYVCEVLELFYIMFCKRDMLT
jgi:hypothetical protein